MFEVSLNQQGDFLYNLTGLQKIEYTSLRGDSSELRR